MRLALLSFCGWMLLGGAGCGDSSELEAARGSDRLLAGAAFSETTCISFQRGTSGTVADAKISNRQPDKNFASGPVASISAVNRHVEQVLLRFDTSGIPALATISSATLTVWQTNSGRPTSLKAHLVTAPWAENSVTWSNFAASYAPDVVASVEASGHTASRTLDVTGVVAGWVSTPASNHGLLLAQAEGKTLVASSESPHADQRPRLEVCYSLAPVATEPSGTSVLLRVVAGDGSPIAGAAVSSQGALFPTDSSGHLLLEDLTPGRFHARVDALGFTSASAVLELREGAHVGAQVTLLPLPAPNSFQAEDGGVIQTEQVRVTLPPNAVVDALGQPVSGSVQVTIVPLDPTRRLDDMPGPLEAIAYGSRERVQLESFFMAEVSLWSNGAPAQLAPGKQATLEFVLPEALASQFEVGDSVPAWWFDLDVGLWREEGAGTIQASQTQPGQLVWVLQVSHFTWWNADAPWTDKSCVNVLVVDEAGVPLENASVSARGISYSGNSRAVYTNAQGRACIEIKRGHTAYVYFGPSGWLARERVEVTGTQEATVCGGDSCSFAQLTLTGINPCLPGSFQECPYSGPAGTQGQGWCRAGRRQCNILGTGWTACGGEVLPSAESCHLPFDEDCDGVSNDDCSCSGEQGQACYGGPSWTRGVGICRGGYVACGLFGNASCQGQQLPMPEDCSTPKDENCDGVSEGCSPGPWAWSNTGPTAAAFDRGHTATSLPNGQVLVTGGLLPSGGNTAAAQVYTVGTGFWSVVGSMYTARHGHTATLLPDGQVLVIGGYGTSGPLASVELYDPATSTWFPVSPMATPRYNHTATLLPNGKVLVAGGEGFGFVGAAEVYEPTTGTWSAVGSMASPRELHTATLLPDGRVLVAGGRGSSGYLASAEVYEPTTGTWSAVGSMASPRELHTATLLPDGRVMVAGGVFFSMGVRNILASVEMYDPVTHGWSSAGSMKAARYSHTATLLTNGTVLVNGSAIDPEKAGAELYNPAIGSSAASPTLRVWRFHTATLLLNGTVLIAGQNGAELYGPVSGSWSTTGAMSSPRFRHTATAMPNDQVLVAGGIAAYDISASAEVYGVAVGTWSMTSPMAFPRYDHTATPLPGGRVLVTGGQGTSGRLASTELYDPEAGTWSMTSPMALPRSGHTASLLPSGRVLVTGGDDTSGRLASTEVYDPATGTWSTSGSMALARSGHTATLLPDGRVLVTGGSSATGTLSSAEVYNPATGTWRTVASMASPRSSHTALLLPTGQVFVTEGGSAELYNPETDTWTDAGFRIPAFNGPTVTLVNGRVLVAGGYGVYGNLRAKAEVFNPPFGAERPAGAMAVPRFHHQATLLPNGRVLITGGLGSNTGMAELYKP